MGSKLKSTVEMLKLAAPSALTSVRMPLRDSYYDCTLKMFQISTWTDILFKHPNQSLNPKANDCRKYAVDIEAIEFKRRVEYESKLQEHCPV